MSDPALKQSTYLPTLDGWRAVSIVLVILHHSQIHFNVPIFAALLRSISKAGEVGVELFFAISGLLICSRLLDEETRFGQISVKSFYLRRCFRILPAALFYLLVIAILAAFHIIPLLPVDWFAALFFFRNYAMVFEYLHHSPLAIHWYTGHFWSLSMEEHFYLVLPGVLVFFKRTRRWVLFGFVIAVALRRFVVAHLLQNNYQISFRTDTHADALFIPAVIALLLYPLLRNQAARRWIPAWSFPILLAVEIVLLFNRIPFFSTLQATVIPLLILSTVLHPLSLPGRVLEMKPVRWIGWISYSLYLWQQLFFGANFVSSPPQLAALREWPINLAALLACAFFSYYVVEKPFIRLGHRLSLARMSIQGAKRPAQAFHQPAPEMTTSSRVFMRFRSGQRP
jgi:peptidoglycan/LPS O-acetylase OafA/YrhL